MTHPEAPDLATAIGVNLPYLRRYARALTGSQTSGDAYAAATLEGILAEPELFQGDLNSRVALFKVFHSIWVSSGGKMEIEKDDLALRAQEHLSALTADTREVLLLRSLEEFSAQDVAEIMGQSLDDIEELNRIAHEEMSKAISGKVMVIEDEAIIAVDLEGIVSDMGHRVTGIARTETGAIDLFKRERPDLILSDIQLADKSSGIDAVNRILSDHPDIPVIFITAFPEKLLTGDAPEPAFLISKPYTQDQVQSAVSQAMFFSSTEVLKA